MTRDLELIRKIMFAIQAKPDWTPEIIKIEGYDDEIVGPHVEMLFKEGLLNAVEHSTVSANYSQILVKDLSWRGHDFVGAITKNDVWQRIKDTLGPDNLAIMSLSMIKDVSHSMSGYVKGTTWN